jgi:hypothetical protein
MNEIIGKRVMTYDGHIGTVIKRFKPTGRNMSVHIKENDGRIWACPETDIVDLGGNYE